MMAVASAFLLSSCFPSLEMPESESGELSVSRTITDTKGRQLKVTIIGKSANSITFVRESDREKFTIPVTNLSKEDQTFVAGLPMPSSSKGAMNPADEVPSNASGPLGFAVDRRKEIMKNLDRIAKDIPKYTKAPSKVTSLNRERDKLMIELKAVNEEIKLLKSK